MPSPFLCATLCLLIAASSNAATDASPLSQHCAHCHGGDEPEGDFRIASLGNQPNGESLESWISSLDYVVAGEMPPNADDELTPLGRQQIIQFLKEEIRQYESKAGPTRAATTRRLNNREFANSVRDVLMIEDIGTHEPVANLIGDTLREGFDTNGEALGLSNYHLNQYLAAVRKIVEATILAGEKPSASKHLISSSRIKMTDVSNRQRPERNNRTTTSIDFRDLRQRAYFEDFSEVPVSGRYRITVRAAGMDRGVYPEEETGLYDDDPIKLRVHLGDRTRDFDLLDNRAMEIQLDEWLAAGTAITLSYPTDGLRQKGNGNFKFQHRITHDYLKEHDRDLYDKVVNDVVPKARWRSDQPSHWSHWTAYWRGPRPRLFNATIEGPYYESWPPKRQLALLGENPQAEDAERILQPLAERAWRREVALAELRPIGELVRHRVAELGVVEAFKEGIVAILVSPSFLLVHGESGTPSDRFATKLSYFLESTTPSERLRQRSANGDYQSYANVLKEVRLKLNRDADAEFLHEFPNAWLELDRINFMAPDPDRFPLYDRKRLSDDMRAEVQAFFRHLVDNNLPVTELITADYSFVNADLARVYGVSVEPRDSRLRKHRFTDGRRGGLLGMGAFLTLTADSQGTSPIHRAVYVMENFLGIHPSPPPADVKISEPDVRAAKSIRDVLRAHQSSDACASCHRSIDPFGYAFENFDPMGSWRDYYPVIGENLPSHKNVKGAAEASTRARIAIDASATFVSGIGYKDIRDFREFMATHANRERFVRCFIKKLLYYANGEEPLSYTEVEEILLRSREHDYRVLETIAAVIHSPLFREP